MTRKPLCVTVAVLVLLTGCQPSQAPFVPTLTATFTSTLPPAFAPTIAPTPTSTPTATPKPTAVPEALPANLTSDIDAAAKGVLDRLLLPGLTLAIRYGSRPVYIKGYGYANITTSTPAQANTIYEIGSITKQFTAAAIMQLVERGKLGLDDPVSKFLRDYPKPGRSVLIRQL